MTKWERPKFKETCSTCEHFFVASRGHSEHGVFGVCQEYLSEYDNCAAFYLRLDWYKACRLYKLNKYTQEESIEYLI